MNDPAATASVWGVFVGKRGDQLPVFNRSCGPFPPKLGSTGYIAIGWPALGDMRIWANDYNTYLAKFQVAYADYESKNAQTVGANMLWNFAFEMQRGDWVICPCSAEGVLLVGQIEDDYEASWEPEPGQKGDFVHFRKVRWLHVIAKNDSRHAQLNRIGQLTVSRQNLSTERLQSIINDQDSKST